MTLLRRALTALCVAAPLLATAAEPPAPAPAAAGASLPGATIQMSRQVDFVSAVNGHRYRIQVATPYAPPPPTGFPVLYVLDGDGYFGAYSAAARLRAVGGELEPAVVVGIGYPDAEGSLAVSMRRRQYDLTPTDADAETKSLMPNEPQTELGGADAFLQVIEREIKPRVASLVAVDPDRAILFGHSLGGLFALHALFTHPESFRTYLVLSPSIWWNNRAVLAGEAAFSRRVADGRVRPRVDIRVGGAEQSVPKGPLPPGFTPESVAKMTAKAAMIDNARALADRLRALPGAPGYEVRFEAPAGESHMSVMWASVNPFLDFALPVPPAPAPAAH